MYAAVIAKLQANLQMPNAAFVCHIAEQWLSSL